MGRGALSLGCGPVPPVCPQAVFFPDSQRCLGAQRPRPPVSRSAALARRSHSRALPPTGLQTETSPCPSGALRGVNSIKFPSFCSGSRIQWPRVADTRESQLRPTGPTLARARAHSPTICLKKGSRGMPGEMLGIKANWCEGAVLYTLYKCPGFLHVGSEGHISCVVEDQSEGGSSRFLSAHHCLFFARTQFLFLLPISYPSWSPFRWLCDTCKQQCLLSCR